MGNRANFVVVQDQDWRLYYAHWAGCRMLDGLIGGPELALRYADGMGICRELAALWPGWQTESWGDRFEEQASRYGRAVRLPDLDLVAGADSARDWIRRRVYQRFADSPASHSAAAAGRDSRGGGMRPTNGSNVFSRTPPVPPAPGKGCAPYEIG
jgi:hypothetical protein